ncbi:MAG TPA: hypothetical protein VNC50_16180, partial [Planctomycetia bacterium]|nr:hypothetical protein [Planctomycetia bacterium]
WFKSQPAVVPDTIAKQLERQGCRVNEERRLFPVELADGRRLGVCVDQVQLQVVGRRPVL